MNDKVPCRVSADLRAYMRKQDEAVDRAAQRKFDPWDEGQMHDLFGKRMGPALSTLLIALEQIERSEQSFGPDKEKSFDFIRPHLATLKDACLKTYEEDL